MSKTAAAYIKETVALRDKIEGAFIILGERFHKILEDGLWKGTFESYAEFLAEMRISEANASKLMTVYRTYVVEHGVSHEKLARAGWSNLYTAIPLLKEKNAEEVVQKATALRRADISDEVREKQYPEHDCKGETVRYRICDTCGKRERV